MLNQQQWNVAFAQLDALRKNMPRSVTEARVAEYHAILHALQVASRDESLVNFRVPDSEVKPIVLSARRGTRRFAGHATYSKEKYCDAEFFKRQVEALWRYIQGTQAQSQTGKGDVGKQNDYWSMTDGELEQLATQINVRAASMMPRGDRYIDRDRIIDALLKRDKALRESDPQPSHVVHVNGDMYGSNIQQGTSASKIEAKQGTTIDSKSHNTLHDVPEEQPASHRGLSIFISHSSKDAELALALIDLLTAGLGLVADQIRCSSVDGYRLPVGVNTESKLREEVNAAKVVVGLITPSSLDSYYVMFELGARWGANLFLAPLLAGVKANELSGPLGLLNALSANNEAQLHQLLEDISKQLGLQLQPAASYVRHVSAVKALVDAIANPATTQPAATAPVKQKLKMTLSAEGTPPSQLLKVVANRHVKVSRVEYMLSSEASMAGEDVSLEGETIETPINDGSVLKVWNTPRPDRNHYDHSGPAKIAVTVSVDGETEQYILPVQMEFMMQNNTAYRKLVGSKTFYG